MGQRITQFFEKYITNWYFPELRVTDVIEVIIIALFLYRVIVWIKNTKAWMLLKGMAVLGVFMIVATVLQMHTILWLGRNLVNVLATAAIVVFQPELRRALEKLGEKDFLSSVVAFDANKKEKGRFTEKTIDGIVEATFAMGEAKTGALIVVEQAIKLTEYEKTGIEMDCIVSSQILLNIFEHNTPLHDGAIIIRGDRIVSATCYLPLSDNMGLSKDLGTRHRAAVGLSEVSDALVIIVSEENGKISVALGGQLVRDVTPEYLRGRLTYIQNKNNEPSRLSKLWKGRLKDERDSDKESGS